jgi:hypothetical protein
MLEFGDQQQIELVRALLLVDVLRDRHGTLDPAISGAKGRGAEADPGLLSRL